MKKLCGLLLSALIILCACQKEVSFENGAGLSAEGSLQSESTGDCLPKEVAGTYEAGVELISAANAIEVTVNVTKTGPYLIYTDTVNGYYFRASGSFTSTGITTVTIPGKGTPAIEGIDNFRVIFDSSECILPVTVGPAGTPAEFTFAGGPGSCMDFTANGDYVVNVDLTNSNTVTIKLNVTVAGSYTISTNASNGMTFTSSGTVAVGEQIITLTGAGKPVNPGVTPIPIEYNGSSCSFSVNVLTVAPLKDYFPRTAGSNWSYEIDDVATDSALIRAKPGTTTINGNPFNTFEATTDAVGVGFANIESYRKSGGSYYKYTDVGAYLSLDASQNAEFIFLKDDQNVGATWTTAAYTGTLNGVAVKVRIKFTIVQKDVVTTQNTSVISQDYPNTIVVEERYEVDPGNGTFVDATAVWGYYRDYYARNIGWIRDDAFDPTDPSTIASKILLRRYQVNP